MPHTSPGPDPLARLIAEADPSDDLARLTATDDSDAPLADALLEAGAGGEITWDDVARAIADLHGVLDGMLADTPDPLLDWADGGVR